MARLTRKNMKVFAANASNNGVFGSLEAGNPTVTNDVEQIQGLTAWGAGWNAATLSAEKLPPLEEFQGVQYVTTYQQAYLMQEGIPEWASTVTYYKGSVTKKVTATGFQIYNSLTDNNLNHQLSDTANWKLVMDSDDLYAYDSDVVHIAGAETITGEKTFTQNITVAKTSGSTINIKLTDATQGTPPASGEYNGFLYFRDSSNNGLGAIKFAYQSSGVSYMNMYAMKHDLSGNNPTIGVYCDANNVGYATAPSTRSDRNNGTDIVTRNWIPDDTRIVHTTGNESISGTKTFAADIIETIGAKRNTTPSSNQYRGIGIHDSDNNMYMSFLGAVDTSKNASAFMRVFNPNNTSTTAANTTYFTLHYDADGSTYATCPASAKTHSVVTTESITKSGTGALKLGNGVIIQWGNFSVTKNTTHTVTMPLAFSSTSSYRLSFMPISNTIHQTMPTITTKGTKTFGIKIGDWNDTNTLDWVAIGY